MPKAKCSCGALLRIPEGKDRFRCPQCDKLLKLPTRKKPKPKPRQQMPQIAPIEFDPSVDDDGPTLTEYPRDDSSDEFAVGAMMDDDSDDEIAMAPPPQPARKGRPERTRARAKSQAQAQADPPEQPFPLEDEAPPEHLGYPRARAWSRVQLALVGALLATPLIPLEGSARLDGWVRVARNIDLAGFADLGALLLPVAGALALIVAVLPIGRFRGQLVAGLGLAAGVLTLAHHASLGRLPLALAEHVRPQALLGLGSLAAAAAGLMVAAAQVRGRAPSPGYVRAVGALAAIAFLYAVGSLIDAERALAQATDRWAADVFAVTDVEALYPSATDQAKTVADAVPHLHMGALIALILCALCSLLGTLTTSKWVARVSAWTGMLGLLAVPLFGGAMALHAYPPEAMGTTGLQDVVAHFGPVWGPLTLWWLGARDVLADGLTEPAE